VFTGLVADLGAVAAVDETPDGVRLTIATALTSELGEGDSIAVDGVCLTATAIDGEQAEDLLAQRPSTMGRFAADVMNETLDRCTLGRIAEGAHVNLELALRASDRLGGHIMQGHVDGVGTIAGVREDGFARVVTIAAGPQILRYVVQKGSIAVDGVSLTVARIDEQGFDVSLIPETLERTTLGAVGEGQGVNLEVDVLAKYVEKLLAAR